jgi:hypothetical protein
MNDQNLFHFYDINSSKPSCEPVRYWEDYVIFDRAMDNTTESLRISDSGATATIGLTINQEIDTDMAPGLIAKVVSGKIFQQQLDEMRHLPDNWNGYGSAPPNHVAIRNSLEALYLTLEMDFPPSQVVPSAQEGVGISFASGEKRAIIECFNDGDIVVIKYEGDSDPEVREIGGSREEIKDSLLFIYDFIYGKHS